MHVFNRSRLLPGAAVILLLGACGEQPQPMAVADPSLSAAHSSASPIGMSFSKCLTDPAGIWDGQVFGGVNGSLTTILTGLRVSGPIWHVDFDWIVDAGPQSFRAELSGTLNNRTGSVVMNGRVAEGWLEGARVHEEGSLTDAEAACFAGTIRIMPATAR